TIRDHVTGKRRAFVRFFACQEDLSHDSPDAALPEAVASGKEPFLIVGAIAGGRGERMQPVMQAIKQTPTPSKGKLWTGRALSGLVIGFLLMDTTMKLLKVQAAIDGTIQLGYREAVLVPLGIALLLCTLLYAIPRTAIVGAVVLTGYLGGAVATHV